jgi:glycosyltransferase involved in cell wall biosynthesis
MTRPLRILAIHRYYWPDAPPYASLLRAIVARWTDSGHEVDVLTSQPSYKPELANERRPRQEQVDAATVRRVAMRPDRSGRGRRVLNLVRFPALVAWRILRGPGYDVVMCSTAPPVLLGAAVSWAAHRRGATFVYHCMDVHPEIGAISGEFANPWVRRVLLALDRAACRRAAAVVVLSGDMRDALLRRDPALADRIVVINNFDLPDFDAASAPAPVAAAPDRLRVVFTGNIGRFQALEPIVGAVLDGDGLDDVELVLMGEGGAKADLARRVDAAPADRRGRVHLLPHGTPAEARALAETADLGLVSLTPGVISYAYPSKTATYLAASLPVLLAVDAGSELARTVADEGIGAVLPADPAGIRDVLADLASRRDDLAAMRVRAREVWAKEFSAEETLPRWDGLLERVTS